MRQNIGNKFVKFAILILFMTMLFIITACGGDKDVAAPAVPISGEPVQSPQEETQTPFYENKTITFIIGYNPGGGTDLLGRIYAKHLPKHIPGEPNIVIQNLPGGGGIAAANVVFNNTAPDGFTFALPGRSNYINAPVLNDPAVNFQLDEFEWIGSFGDDYNVLIISNSLGIETFDELTQAPENSILFGGWSRTNQAYIIPNVLKEEGIVPAVRTVTGYDGAGEVILALERGEVHAAVLPNSTTLASLSAEIQSGKYRILAERGGGTPGIVQIEDVVSPQGLELISFVAPIVGPTMLAPPGTNPEALEILREGFLKTVVDPELLADFEAQDISLTPLDAKETLEFMINNLNTSAETLERFNALTE